MDKLLNISAAGCMKGMDLPLLITLHSLHIASPVVPVLCT